MCVVGEMDGSEGNGGDALCGDAREVTVRKVLFSSTNLEKSAEQWIEWLTDSLRSGSIEIGEYYKLKMWDEACLTIITRYVHERMNICDTPERSLV